MVGTVDDAPEVTLPVDGLQLTADERRLIGRSDRPPASADAVGQGGSGRRPVMRAAVLRAWCLHPNGTGEISLTGARVTGPTNLAGLRLSSVLRLLDCEFTDPIDLTGTRVAEAVHLSGCALPGLRADGLSVTGDLVLDRVRGTGTFGLADARIGGSLSCAGAVFANPGGVALDARRLMVEGSTIFDRCRVAGGFILASARVGGTLNLCGAECANPDGRALDAEHLAVSGAMLCQDGFQARGEVRLSWAQLGALQATGAHLVNPDGDALSAQGLSVANGLFLDSPNGPDATTRFHAEGRVLLREARVAGQIKCTGSMFTVPTGKTTAFDAGLAEAAEVLLDDGFVATAKVVLEGGTVSKRLTCNGGTFHHSADGVVALNLDGLDCAGRVFLGRDFTAHGEVQLLGATIGQEFNCTAGTFNAPATAHPVALRGDGMCCEGSVFLNDKFQADGEVRLVGAEVRTQLNCSGGRFRNPGATALDLSGVAVAGNVYLNEGCRADGQVQLAAAAIGRELNCRDGEFGGFHARGLKVNTTFTWRPHGVPTGGVDVSFAEIGKLDDDLAAWPDKTNLVGLTFGSLGEPRSGKERREWLGRCEYAPDVYQQLSRVYRQAGREDDARTVAIARQRDRRRRANLPPLARLWSVFLDVTVQYGYQTPRVVALIAALWLGGIYPFHLAQTHHIMEPASSYTGTAPDANNCTASYPCYVPAIYSLEILFPVINLRQVAYWLPSGATGWGQLLWIYVWIAILLGWAMSIAVAGGIGHLFSQKD